MIQAGEPAWLPPSSFTSAVPSPVMTRIVGSAGASENFEPGSLRRGLWSRCGTPRPGNMHGSGECPRASQLGGHASLGEIQCAELFD